MSPSPSCSWSVVPGHANAGANMGVWASFAAKSTVASNIVRFPAGCGSATTRAALCLVKVVATEWPRLEAEPLRAPSVVKEFYLGKKPRFRQIFSNIWSKILSTPTGETYAYELSYVRRMVMNEHEWNDDEDIKPAWWHEP